MPTTTATINPATTLQKAGNAPGGNKLIAKFPGPDYPDSVQIKGTTDKQSVKGDSGVWISGNKYTSTAVTLQLIVGGTIVQENKYDANGNLESAGISGFKVSASSGFVSISWTSVQENNLANYVIDRKLSTDDTFSPITSASPQGAGIAYTVTDAPPPVGSYDYRLRAVFNDGSDDTLASGSVTLITPDAAISNYTVSASAGIASISWTSTKEVSLSVYVIDRKLSSDANYTTVTGMSPQGANTPYTVSDAPPAPGTYSYKLRALFTDNTDKTLGEQSVTV